MLAPLFPHDQGRRVADPGGELPHGESPEPALQLAHIEQQPEQAPRIHKHRQRPKGFLPMPLPVGEGAQGQNDLGGGEEGHGVPERLPMEEAQGATGQHEEEGEGPVGPRPLLRQDGPGLPGGGEAAEEQEKEPGHGPPQAAQQRQRHHADGDGYPTFHHDRFASFPSEDMHSPRAAARMLSTT